MYLAVAIMKKMLKIYYSLSTILQILNLTIFGKIPILQVFIENRCAKPVYNNHNHLNLFNFFN